MSYRPIADVWILCRAKLKADDDGNKQSYYGAFPAGFLHRARQMLGVRRTDPVLHVCGGMVRECLYRGFEPNDRTLDLDPETAPDYQMDARSLGVGKGDLFPIPGTGGTIAEVRDKYEGPLWPAMLIDRPYTTADHAEYDVPPDVFPSDINDLLKRALTCVEPGGRVGVLDYIWPSPPTKLGKEVAVIAVGTGRNNRARWFTVFERLVPTDAPDEEHAGGDVGASEPLSMSGNQPQGRTEVGEVVPEPVAAAPGAEPSPSSGPGSRSTSPGVEAGSASAQPSRRRRRKQEEPPAETFTCERCKEGGLKKGATILSEHDGKRRCGPCHRTVAGGMIPDPAEGCVACGGTGRSSKGGPCLPCQNRRTLAQAAVAHVCHGCKEPFTIGGGGMERYEPLTDQPHVWHRACWDQKRHRDEEAARKGREERDRAEAREKGWPICPTCARPITPDQKNVDGRHYACGKPAAPRRRRRAASSSMEGGFGARA